MIAKVAQVILFILLAPFALLLAIIPLIISQIAYATRTYRDIKNSEKDG